jgi:hypothetical protein
MKSKLKYFLSVFLLLLCGYHQLSTHFYRENAFFSPALDHAYAHHHLNQVHGVSFSTKKIQDGLYKSLYEENEEDEDKLLIKKQLKDAGVPPSIFFVQTHGYFLDNNEKIPPSHQYLSSGPCCSKQVALQVFRI